MLRLMCMLRTVGLTGHQALKQRRDDRGQTAAEYLGIIVVVAAIIVAIANTHVGATIATAITTQITTITGAGG